VPESQVPAVPHGWRVLRSGGLWVAMSALCLFAVTLPGGLPLGEPWRSLWLFNLVYVGASVACVVEAVHGSERRWAWGFVSLALVSTLAANVYYSLVLGPMDSPPYPSWADAGYLLFYPFLYLALMILLQARVPRWHPSVWLDGLMMALGVASLGAAFALAPVLQLTRAELSVVITNLAYPLGDLLLMSTVIGGLTLVAAQLDLQWVLLGAGVLAGGVGDSIYLVQDSAGQYTEGSILDLTWLVGAVLIGLAALPSTASRSLRLPRRRAGSGRGLLIVPALVTIACLAVLLPVGDWQGSVVAQWLAGSGLVVVAARYRLTFREVLQLPEVRRQAVTDELTGLVNRRGFTAQAEALVRSEAAGSATPTGPVALLLLDLDQFKEVNDSLGHHAGDLLLSAIGQRLSSTCRTDQDLLARLGGDEFAILLPDTGVDGAEHAARRIRTTLTDPFMLDGVRVEASISIGIAVAPQHGTTLSLLMRRADIAMYRAKATRGGHAVYDPDRRDDDSEDRLHRVAELRAALDSGQITVHYQPKVDLATGVVTDVEALARWDHPTRGLLSPSAFLGLADEYGLMPALTAAVLDQALAQAAIWRADRRELTVAVNLPPAAVVDTALPDRIIRLLARHHLPPTALTLEITEESLLDDRVRARDVLARLRHAGVKIAIDDYGRGYSSLAYLRELPVDELKLDRSFIDPMVEDGRAAAIVRSTVELAHALGLRIVAEGVEHPTAAEELSTYGCDAAQGFLYSHALPPAELARWLDTRTDAAAGVQPAGSGSAAPASIPIQ